MILAQADLLASLTLTHYLLTSAALHKSAAEGGISPVRSAISLGRP